MILKRSDYFFALAAMALAVVGTLAIANPTSPLGLYALMGLAGIVLVMGIIIKPSLGAYILIIAVFTNISKHLTGLGYPSIIKPLVGVVAVAIVIHYSYAERPPGGNERTSAVQSFLFVYLIAAVLSFIFATDKDIAATAIIDLAKDIVIIYCVIFALRDTHSWKVAVWIVLVTTAALCLLGLYQVLTGNYSQMFMGLGSVQMQQVLEGSSTPRLGGPVNDPNVWGQVLVAIVPLVVYRIIYEPRRLTKIIGVITLSILLFEVLNTYSRGAYLALAILVVLIMFSFRISPLIPIAGVAVAGILFFSLPPVYTQRFVSLSALVPSSQAGIYQDSSFRGRASEMLTGLRMFMEHPLFGVGAGNYRTNYQKYAQLIGIEVRAEERDAHSLYIQVLAETGLIGALAFAGIVTSLFSALGRISADLKRSKFRTTWRPWIVALQMSLIGYMLTSIFLHDAYIRYFWILVAICISAIRISAELLEHTKHATPSEAPY
ncbi:MAG: O-antigen ligase family protein [Chloroflexota bacterium]